MKKKEIAQDAITARNMILMLMTHLEEQGVIKMPEVIKIMEQASELAAAEIGLSRKVFDEEIKKKAGENWDNATAEEKIQMKADGLVPRSRKED